MMLERTLLRLGFKTMNCADSYYELKCAEKVHYLQHNTWFAREKGDGRFITPTCHILESFEQRAGR